MNPTRTLYVNAHQRRDDFNHPQGRRNPIHQRRTLRRVLDRELDREVAAL